MRELSQKQFRSTEEQLALCGELLERCRQSNEPLADMIATLTSILSANLQDDCAALL